MGYWDTLQNLTGNIPLILNGAAGAILVNNKILLVKHHQKNLWQIPGGVQEIDESLEMTVKREIKEELNIEMEIGGIISILSSKKWNITFGNGKIIQQMTVFYLMKGIVKTKEILLQKEEIDDYNFFDLSEIPDNTFECCKEKCRMLKEYIKTNKTILENR